MVSRRPAKASLPNPAIRQERAFAIGRIITLCHQETQEILHLHLAATGSDRLGFKDVLDIPCHDPQGKALIEQLPGGNFTWQGHRYTIDAARTLDEWRKEHSCEVSLPSREFRNSESGVRGNPTPFRW